MAIVKQLGSKKSNLIYIPPETSYLQELLFNSEVLFLFPAIYCRLALQCQTTGSD